MKKKKTSVNLYHVPSYYYLLIHAFVRDRKRNEENRINTAALMRRTKMVHFQTEDKFVNITKNGH